MDARTALPHRLAALDTERLTALPAMPPRTPGARQAPSDTLISPIGSAEMVRRRDPSSKVSIVT